MVDMLFCARSQQNARQAASLPRQNCERHRNMRAWMMIIFCILAPTCQLGADQIEVNSLLKIAPDRQSAFKWPYYLYLPRMENRQGDSVTMLVMPNNSGKCDDSIEFHDQRAFRQINNYRDIADELGLIILMPVFPRPETHGEIYTHALDRDALLTSIPELQKLDLQLLAMINDAKVRCNNRTLSVHQKVLMLGHSAAGMFVNRFTLLHPEIVKAAVIGSPGGWPIAPLREWQGRMLHYPIGISDIAKIAGQEFNQLEFDSVALFFFMGDQDTNDAVMFDDAYNIEDRELVLELFGKTPISRWPLAQEIYSQVGSKSRFKLYKGIGHMINDEMWQDIKEFLKAHR